MAFEQLAEGEDVELLQKVYGPGKLAQIDYENFRREQIATGLPTWLAERTKYGGTHLQFWYLGRPIAYLVEQNGGITVMDPDTAEYLAHDLTFPDAIEFTEHCYDGITPN